MGRRTVTGGLAALAFGVVVSGSALAQEPPKTPQAALRLEAADALPRTALYEPPANLAASKPGGLIRQEPFDGYALPKGVRAVRILYHSRSAGGRDTAASAVVLVPPGAPPAGGWP